MPETPFDVATLLPWYVPTGSFLLVWNWTLATPSDPVVAVCVIAAPLDLVILKETLEPGTGEPLADTMAIIVTVCLRV